MPSSELDRALKRDPLTFLKKHTVVPPNAPKHMTWGTHLGKGAIDGHQTVGTSGRVAYGSLRTSDGYPNAYDLDVEYPVAQNADRVRLMVPMWFLPWNSERLVGIQITPKLPSREGRPATSRPRADARASSTPLRIGRARADAGATEYVPPLVTDPDLFFTAAINGCSVFVTGDPAAPRVYHGGTQEKYATPDAAVHKWQSMFREAEPQSFHDGSFSEVNKTHYIRAREAKKVQELQVVHRPSGTEFIPQRDYVTDTSSAYKKFLKAGHTDADGKRNVMIQRMLPFGCVFGVRDAAGLWSFFLQESVKITYTLGKETDGRMQLVATNKTTTRPMCVTQIFPGVGGGATLKQQSFTLLDA
jgi:hypothetical protein